MTNEWMAWLRESTLATSAAIVLVMALRMPMRRAFGAVAAYAAWMLVPAAALATLLPAPIRAMAIALPAIQVVSGPNTVNAMSAPVDLTVWVLSAWLIGAVVASFAAWRNQRRFLLALGPLTLRADGLMQAQSSGLGLPAVIGLRARIVLPADFETRHRPEERELILAHEKIHVRRGDIFVQATLLGFRCVYWFNPLVWIGAERIRRDQELACDASVIARHPGQRRVYGEAMVRASLAQSAAPLACQWVGNHPLKERLVMLKHRTPSTRTLLAGALAVALLTTGGGFAAWALQTPQVPQEAIDGSALKIEGDSIRFVAQNDTMPDASRAVAAPKAATSTPAPPYPQKALADKQSGKVVVIVDVNADGSVANAAIDSSEPRGVFDATTLEAVKQWHFTPSMEHGKAVPGRVRVPIWFDAAGKMAHTDA